MQVLSRLIASIVAMAVLAGAGAAFAEYGQPANWQLGLQDAASPVMADIVSFHTFLLYLITIISVLVLALLLYVMMRFNSRSNPEPSRTTHSTPLEVAWTVIPVVILVAIAVPSFRLLFYQLDIPKADLTLKATGKQWYWTYNYPDNGNFEFDSLLVRDKEGKPAGEPRLLAVDNEVVVPIGKVVRVQVTAAEVIHSFAVPSFGIKIDAVPGRLNETWFQATREGVYYGQCSELCGKDHAFMPIAVRVMNEKDFAAWVEQTKKKLGRRDDTAPTAVAAAGAAKAE